MSRINKIKTNEEKIKARYKALIEQAYNFRQTDSALSDISEFKAIKLLNKLNQLNFLYRSEDHNSTIA